MTKIRAKFSCISVKKVKGWAEHEFLYEAELRAVTGDVRETSGDQEEVDENRSFFAATPFGEVRLGSVRADLFDVGRDYYLEFLPVGNGG